MYNNCTCRSSENIYSSKGCVQEKGKRGQNVMKFNLAKKNCILEFHPVLTANVLFKGFF
jgi:hypothetical protein